MGKEHNSDRLCRRNITRRPKNIKENYNNTNRMAPKYPGDSKNLFLSIIAGLIVAIVTLSIDLLATLSENHKITALVIGLFFLFVFFIASLGYYTYLKTVPLRRSKKK
jgi:hypothetical protein